MRCGILSYDPWIWLKITSLSSTASVLNDGRISLEIPSIHSEIYIFFKTSKYATFEGGFVMFSCAKNKYTSVRTKNLIVHCGRVDAFLEFFLLGSESWLVATTSSLLPEKTKNYIQC